MTEYTEMIERKRKQLQAEEWAKGVQHIHVHRLTMCGMKQDLKI